MGRGKQLDRPPRLGHARLVKAVREAPAATEHVERGQPLPHLGSLEGKRDMAINYHV